MSRKKLLICLENLEMLLPILSVVLFLFFCLIDSNNLNYAALLFLNLPAMLLIFTIREVFENK